MKENKSEKFMVRLTPTQLNQIKEVSEKKKRTTSDMIRVIISDYLEKINL